MVERESKCDTIALLGEQHQILSINENESLLIVSLGSHTQSPSAGEQCGAQVRNASILNSYVTWSLLLSIQYQTNKGIFPKSNFPLQVTCPKLPLQYSIAGRTVYTARE
jgi:hypothetical protein